MLDRPVVFASSAPADAGEVLLPADAGEVLLPADAAEVLLPADCSWVRLPADAPASPEQVARADAGGRLHWAPPHHRGLLDRHRALLDLVAEHDPALAVVDVSVEVTTLLRVSGVPVITVRLPGARDDAPHQLAHDLADQVVMPVPASWAGAAVGGPGVSCLGLVSLLRAAPTPVPSAGPVLVLLGAGGSALTPAHCRDIAAAAGTDVQVVGMSAPAGYDGHPGPALRWLGQISDPGAAISAASVVIGGAGLGTVADVATIGRPFVCVPDDRPFGEQRATAAALAAHESASVHPRPPLDPAGWARALAAAEAAGPLTADTGGAVRFARLLETAAAASCASPC